MKKTSPWFILLFPIAVPAVIVLDFFGHRIFAFVFCAALAVSFASYAWSLVGKFRSLRAAMTSLAESLFDAGAWSIRHYPYHHTLSGTASGRRLHVSLLGHHERSLCQLFLECPVARDLFVEEGADLRELPAAIAPIASSPGFRSLQALSRNVPPLKRLLGGLAGSGGPGLVLRRQVDDPFSLPALQRDIGALVRLSGSMGGAGGKES
jgi:hypothetical protein